MARLPIPRSDADTWGDLLNEFLSVEHNANGTLKASGSLSTKATDSTVVHLSGNETIGGTKTFSAAPIVPSGAFPESAVANLTSDLGAKEISANKGAVNGYASLDGSAQVPASQLQNVKANLRYLGAWTPSTAYATNDLVTFAGSTYVATSSFTSGTNFSLSNWASLSSKAGVYNVKDYGVKGDGVTDDTSAINALISAAFAAGVANGTNYAEIYFPPAVYLIAGNPTTGGSTYGSAQIPLPIIPEGPVLSNPADPNSPHLIPHQKFILVLKGTADATALYHWLQTVPQEAGAVLRTTYDAGTALPATGAVSVIGGPNAQGGGDATHQYGTSTNRWNNMLVVVDGITIEVPQNGNMSGFDFQGIAEANVLNASVLARSTVTGAPTPPDPNWSFGLYMPQTNNNDNCNIGYYSCEGLVYGLIIHEHVQANSLRLINCFDGLVVWPASGFPHRNVISYASIENCKRCIVFASTGIMKVDILCADIEAGSEAIILDPNNAGSGTIGISSNGSTGDSLNTALGTGSTAVSGGANLKIINLDQTPGHVAAPSVAATTVSFKNPFWRDAIITITGGVVTGIDVDGATQFTATPATVYLPTGKSITLTYSSAPSWQWTLL